MLTQPAGVICRDRQRHTLRVVGRAAAAYEAAAQLARSRRRRARRRHAAHLLAVAAPRILGRARLGARLALSSRPLPLLGRRCGVIIRSGRRGRLGVRGAFVEGLCRRLAARVTTAAAVKVVVRGAAAAVAAARHVDVRVF